MKAIKLAAIISIIAEAVLCGAYALLGKFSLMHDRDTNLLGLFTTYFHAPGFLLAGYLLPTPKNGASWWILPFVIFTGVVQFFLVTWFIIAVKPREKRAADRPGTNGENGGDPKP